MTLLLPAVRHIKKSQFTSLCNYLQHRIALIKTLGNILDIRGSNSAHVDPAVLQQVYASLFDKPFALFWLKTGETEHTDLHTGDKIFQFILRKSGQNSNSTPCKNVIPITGTTSLFEVDFQ